MLKTICKVAFLLLLAASTAPRMFAQATAVVLSPVPQLQFFDQNGKPLAFGCVFSYVSQTSTPLATFTDHTGTIQNSDPVILSAGGSANIWLQAGQAYTLIVKSAGGTNCFNGTTQYTVDGVGAGLTTLTTVVTPVAGAAMFADQSQNQLFTLTLTGNVVGQPVSAVGIIPPGLITFQVTQDPVGGHTFSWPINMIGGTNVCSTANCVTQQTFLWNGTNGTAVGSESFSIGPAFAVPNLFDYGLSASLPVCTSAAQELNSNCNGLISNADLVNASVTYNGQAVALGSTGNVNSGAAAHTMALNEGAGTAITGLTLANDQVPAGSTGADPGALSIPNCAGTLTYSTSTHTFGCSVGTRATASATSCALAANGGEWNCGSTLTWSATLPDANYLAVCTLGLPSPTGSYTVPAGYDTTIYLGTKTTTQVNYVINDDHSGSNGAVYAINCVAVE